MNDDIMDLPDSWSKIKRSKPNGKSLGKGLNSLLGTPTPTSDHHEDAHHDNAPTSPSSFNALKKAIKTDGKTLYHISMSDIVANPNQPRKDFDEDELKELALSIKRNGVLQPILLRPCANSDKYEIIAGERRWRAAQMAMRDDMPAIIHDLDDHDMSELALIENLHRQDLNIIEEAHAYQRLMDNFDYKQSDLSQILSRSRGHIANILRLTQLPISVQEMIKKGVLSFGHAKILAGSMQPETHAKMIVKGNLTVRQTEELLTQTPRIEKTKNKKPIAKNTNIADQHIAQELSHALGVQVSINHIGQYDDKGKIALHFNDKTQFDMLIAKLKN